MNKRVASHGVTLLELIVAAGLMGLLFMGGLQLLSSFLTVQTAKPAQNLSPQYVPLKLRVLLQEAQTVHITEQGRQLSFQQNNQTHKLRFTVKAACQDKLLLELDDKTLAHWPRPTSRNTYGFKIETPKLLKIQLPIDENPIQIWLKNH